MIGQAIYISNFDEKRVVDENIDFYFTSFHIEEEFDENFKIQAKALFSWLKKTNKKIIVDISPRGIQALGFHSLVDFVDTFQVDAIRFDFGFRDDEILQVASKCIIALNASTCDRDTLEKLKHIHKLVAIHNYYPRPETGLDVDYFLECNEMFKTYNIPVIAFISGDEILRGPLYKRLITLEKHRNLSPYLQYMEMKQFKIDHVIIADPKLSQEQLQFIKDTENDTIIRVHATLNENYHYLYNQILTNRKDSPNQLIRIMESRQYATFGMKVTPHNSIQRVKGSITIDNQKYLRYSGEIQITKQDYPHDDKVNVIGHVIDVEILDHIHRNTKFMLIKK